MECIYKIENIANGKFYIGSAVDTKKRWQKHLRDLRNKKHHNVLLQRAWDKYTEKSFEFKVIEECEKLKLIDREQYYLDLLNPAYNICKIAGSQLGMKRSDEVRNKMSFSQRGKTISEQGCRNMSACRMGEKNHWFGKHASDETKRKMSESHKRSWAKRKEFSVVPI